MAEVLHDLGPDKSATTVPLASEGMVSQGAPPREDAPSLFPFAEETAPSGFGFGLE